MNAPGPDKITYFAKTDARGQQVTFGIKAKDRQRHMYVIGKTGMGKSTLLENMAAQDIVNGEGLAFIDPHGSAIEVLLDYIPEHRLDDVVYFAPFDMENPIAFNIMEDVGIDTRHLVVSGLMSTFKKIWEDAWSARMEYILTNALLALIEYPDTTLLSVNRMLADKKYRDLVVENVKDPAVKAYWVDEFASYTERFAAEALPAIQNKIGQFTGNPLIRNIIGQPKSSFDVRKMMDEKKILLINLSKGLVGETNADLIGSMLITKIYLAAMSRAELSPTEMKQMPNFYFYVDEFQSFANSTFANILSEARKYHLNLIIAHQYVAQMEEKIRDAVFGNVGTTVAFRTGPFDAEVLETVFAPQFEATDLVNLGFAQIYLSLMIDGVGSQPFSAVTLPPVQTPSISYKQMVIKHSRKNFTRPRAEVEQTVIDSHAPVVRIEAAAESGGGNKGGFAKPSAFHKVGNEKKFPPKKPAANGSGNNSNGNPAANTNTANRDNNTKPAHTASPARSKPPEKTPQDLKDILAQMTGGAAAQPKPASQTQAAVQPQPQAQTKSEPATPRSAETSASERPRSLAHKSAPKPSTPDDLRNILAKMTEKTNSATKSNGDTRTKRPPQNNQRPNHQPQPEARSQTEPKRQPDQRQPQPSRTAVPADLQSALAQVVQKANNTGSHQTAAVQSTVAAATPPPATEPTTYKQSPEPMMGGSRQPAFEPYAQSSQPDLNQVKKMLRHSGKERPPGT